MGAERRPLLLRSDTFTRVTHCTVSARRAASRFAQVREMQRSVRRYRQFFIWEGPASRAYELVLRGLWEMVVRDWPTRTSEDLSGPDEVRSGAEAGKGGGGGGGVGAGGERAAAPGVALQEEAASAEAAGGGSAAASLADLGNDGDELGGLARQDVGDRGGGPGSIAAGGSQQAQADHDGKDGGSSSVLWRTRPAHRRRATQRRNQV